MASTEVMLTDVRVAVAFLLSEISALLEKGEEKEICLCKELIRKSNQLCASSMPTLMKELPQKTENSIKIT
jgi:uncharacterized tellurite resistance protein B-like protein